ncbi:MAG: DUF1549 domain-containing protein, partial [Cyclobacteriaceae bacterium]|nr:DUF1549 domain-containing protein [Cyclobacteriaceae bacterium]
MDTFKRLFFFVVISTATACSIELPEGVQKAYTDLPEIVDFNFHIRPILSDKCYACHGPDNHTRKGDFRLDTEEGAMAVLKEGGHAFVSNSPGKSEAVKRLISSDPDYLMPPLESKTVLSDREIALIAKWIEQGAVWKEHWSFIPLQKVTIPQVENAKNKVVNPIDNFVWERLTKAGLTLSEEADKERLLRRVTMDLTGLPPSLEEMDAFLADHSDNAYEKVVDRLLSSRAYAERMTMDWLDIARYADSHGFHADGIRYMWPWRDWVIDAFDSNMPYDKFVTTQLAGDLFENRTTDDILATGFQRNHPMTAEGGAIDEEFRIEYVSDRTNSTATAFLGLTME